MDKMNRVAKLKSKLMMMSRTALVLSAAAGLAVTTGTAVTATAFVRNAPILTTASELANGLIGRNSVTAQVADQQAGPGPIAQAVTPLPPEAAPAPLSVPVQTPDLQVAPVQQAQVVVPGTPEAPARLAVTQPAAPVLEPTITPPAEAPPAFIPTASTGKPVVAYRKAQAGPVVYRRSPREICN